jgi:hypothetical protein
MTTHKTGGLHQAYKALILATPKSAPLKKLHLSITYYCKSSLADFPLPESRRTLETGGWRLEAGN